MTLSKTFGFATLCVFSTAITTAMGQTVVPFSSIDRLNSADGGSVWSIDSASDSSLLAGDASSGSNIFETAIVIDISSLDSEIAAASSITFNIAYSAVLGTGQDVTAYLFGTNSTTVPGIGGTNFHNSALAGSDGGTILSADFSAPDVATYDVTSIVKSLTANDSIGILLTSGITSRSGAADDIQFYRQNTIGSEPNGGAYLSIIPEPSTYALLLGASGIALVAFRRRRK